jgi:hypothetical protein
MFNALKKWWERRGAGIEPSPKAGGVYDLAKPTDRGPSRRPKEFDTVTGRALWKARANYHGRLRNLAAMRQGAGKGKKGDGGTYGKWELRRMQSLCDQKRNEIFSLTIKHNRETREALAKETVA